MALARSREIRACDAVEGAVVADAACFGVHWIYSPADVDAALAHSGSSPEFTRAPSKWHAEYNHPPGESSLYGIGALIAAESTRTCDGFNLADYKRRWLRAFGPGGTYMGYVDHTTFGSVLKMMVAKSSADEVVTRILQGAPASVAAGLGGTQVADAVTPCLTLGAAAAKGASLGRAAAAGLPEAEGEEAAALGALVGSERWREANTRCGVDDTQSNFLGKAVAIAALRAGMPDMATTVEAAVRSTQDNDEAVSWALCAAHMVAAAVTGTAKTPGEAVAAGLLLLRSDQRSRVQAAIAVAAAAAHCGSGDHFNAVRTLGGSSCQSYKTVPCAIYALLCGGESSTFEGAVRATLVAGGDNCARACVVGAVMGALRGVPQSWRERTLRAPRIHSSRPVSIGSSSAALPGLSVAVASSQSQASPPPHALAQGKAPGCALSVSSESSRGTSQKSDSGECETLDCAAHSSEAFLKVRGRI
jgi:hypothetical protein